MRPFCLLPPLSVIPDSAVSSPSDKENIEHILPKIQKISEKWTDVLKTAEGLSTGQLNDFESSFGISTLSQLFVNVYILEKSINWELSALKTATKCRVCRRKANDNMILCDMCNRGYHIYCLKPPIESIDEIEGDWFCHFCVPTSVTTTSKKNFPQKSINSVDVNNIHSDEYTEDTQSYTSDDAGYVEDAKEGAHGEICRACKDHLIDKYSEVCQTTCLHAFHVLTLIFYRYRARLATEDSIFIALIWCEYPVHGVACLVKQKKPIIQLKLKTRVMFDVLPVSEGLTIITTTRKQKKWMMQLFIRAIPNQGDIPSRTVPICSVLLSCTLLPDNLFFSWFLQFPRHFKVFPFRFTNNSHIRSYICSVIALNI